MNKTLNNREEIVEQIEIIINRHSPMNNFEIKERCAREISSLLTSEIAKERERLTEKIEELGKWVIDTEDNNENFLFHNKSGVKIKGEWEMLTTLRKERDEIIKVITDDTK